MTRGMISGFKHFFPASSQPLANPMKAHRANPTFAAGKKALSSSLLTVQDTRNLSNEALIQRLTSIVKQAWEDRFGLDDTEARDTFIAQARAGRFVPRDLSKYAETHGNRSTVPASSTSAKKPVKGSITPQLTQAQADLQKWFNNKIIKGSYTRADDPKLRELCTMACGKTFINELTQEQQDYIKIQMPNPLLNGEGMKCIDELVRKRG